MQQATQWRWFSSRERNQDCDFFFIRSCSYCSRRRLCQQAHLFGRCIEVFRDSSGTCESQQHSYPHLLDCPFLRPCFNYDMTCCEIQFHMCAASVSNHIGHTACRHHQFVARSAASVPAKPPPACDLHQRQPIVAAMPNDRRAFAPGGCWFFTVNLLDRRRRFLTDNIDALRKATRLTQTRHPFAIDAMVVLGDHIRAYLRWSGAMRYAYCALRATGSGHRRKGAYQLSRRLFLDLQARHARRVPALQRKAFASLSRGI